MSKTGKFSAVAKLAMAVFSMTASIALSEEMNQLTIENRTAGDITHIFVSAGNSVNYSADILSVSGPLRDQQEITLPVYYPNQCELFNVLAVAANADYFSVFRHEVCDGKRSRLRLGRNYYAGTKKVDPITNIVFENGSSSRFRHLFFAPGDTDAWGIDFLHGTFDLRPGNSVELRLRMPAKIITYGVRAVDENDRTYSFAIDVDDKMRKYIFEIDDGDIDLPGN